MTAKRRLKWLGAALATVVLCAAAAWLLWPAGRPITADTYQSIQLGMPRAEAEALLGGPGGTRQDYCLWLDNRSPVQESGVDLVNQYRHDPRVEYWYQDSGIIILRFDSENRVVGKEFDSVRESTRYQRFRRVSERLIYAVSGKWMGW